MLPVVTGSGQHRPHHDSSPLGFTLRATSLVPDSLHAGQSEGLGQACEHQLRAKSGRSHGGPTYLQAPGWVLGSRGEDGSPRPDAGTALRAQRNPQSPGGPGPAFPHSQRRNLRHTALNPAQSAPTPGQGSPLHWGSDLTQASPTSVWGDGHRQEGSAPGKCRKQAPTQLAVGIPGKAESLPCSLTL